MKRKIGILLCCALVMGMFSVSAMQTEAAACSHPYYFTNMGAVKWEKDASKHREWRGTQWVCTTCGYTYWKDLVPSAPEDHKYPVYGIDNYGNPILGNTCTVCNYTR